MYLSWTLPVTLRTPNRNRLEAYLLLSLLSTLGDTTSLKRNRPRRHHPGSLSLFVQVPFESS